MTLYMTGYRYAKGGLVEGRPLFVLFSPIFTNYISIQEQKASLHLFFTHQISFEKLINFAV